MFLSELNAFGQLEVRTGSLLVDAYEEDAEYTVLPLENTIYGPVTETLDCFFDRLNNSSSSSTIDAGSVIPNGVKSKGKGKGKEKEIIASLDLPIRHCLVVKRGTKMEDIGIVSSHEQVSLSLTPHWFYWSCCARKWDISLIYRLWVNHQFSYIPTCQTQRG